MRLRFWRIVFLISLFLVLFFGGSVYAQLELPALGGHYAVGRTIVRWVDSSRSEVLTEDARDFREVILMLWYPAEPGTGVKAGYFAYLDSLSDSLIESGEVEPWEVFGLHLIRSDSHFNAIPVKTEHPFPIVILSPGNGTNIEFYSSLASEIASHGYVVAGINHPYDVAAVELHDGSVAPYDKDQWSLSPKAHQAYIAERIKVRTADVLYVREQLETLSRRGAFADLMDLDAVAVAGHSLGGITASEACKAEPRLKACMNLDGLQRGGPFSIEETAIPPRQPFMFLTKEAQLHPQLLKRFESMPESYWVVIHPASHQSFTDGPLLQPSLLAGPNQADQLMGLIQEYSLAFLDQTLKGKPNDLLSKTVERGAVSVKVFLSH